MTRRVKARVPERRSKPKNASISLEEKLMKENFVSEEYNVSRDRNRRVKGWVNNKLQ